MKCPKCHTEVLTSGSSDPSDGVNIDKVYCSKCGWKGNRELEPYVESDGFFDLKEFQKGN